MELQSSPFNLISLFLFFSFHFILVKKWNAKIPKLPPGPWRLPFIGSLHHLKGKLPHHNLRDLARKYGPLMYLQLGEIPVVVISSPRVAKAVLKTHDLAFATRPRFMSSDIVFYKSRDISFAPFGDYWRQMRKILTQELLSNKMLKSYSLIRKDELSKLLSSIRLETGSAVNINEKLLWFTSCMTCRLAFGKICNDRDELIMLIREILTLSGGFDVGDLFPSWKLLHNMSNMKARLTNVHHKYDLVMENIINEHQENHAAGIKGNNEFGGEDMIDALLRAKENNELQFPIENDNMKAVILDLFIAGTETSYTAIIWALSELMKHPSVMAKAQAEVRKVFKENENFDENDLDKLPYLKSVIKETLRMHPPVPLLGPRECRDQTEIDGYTVPIKARVMVNAWAIGRDPESWEDPESFKPERFENTSVDLTGNHYQFIPFGSGRRMCPGMSFGLVNTGHPLAQLLYCFDWKLPDKVNANDFRTTETSRVFAASKDDLYLIPTNHREQE
uniref:CYP71D5v3 n=1 Tax=Nicotiana tabacum TaxID=4097 RepID=A1XEJ8_TOBAC|nr:CYP71D5v3 [Nicotiana tabacum]